MSDGLRLKRLATLAAFAGAALLLAPGAQARDRGADGDFSRRESSHFVLFQDVDIDQSFGLRGSRRFEQDVLDALEVGYDRLGALLGLRPRRPIEVVVYDAGVFDAYYSGLVRFPAAGFYHGVIRVRGDVRVHGRLVEVLHHELVHAALDAAAPSLAVPGWVNEGLAEWFAARVSGRRGLTSAEWSWLSAGGQRGAVPSLAALSGRSFGRLDGASARLAYLHAHAAFAHLARRFGERSLQEFCRRMLEGGNADRALQRVYRMDARELDATLRALYR